LNGICCGIWVQHLGICLKKPNKITESSANPHSSRLNSDFQSSALLHAIANLLATDADTQSLQELQHNSNEVRNSTQKCVAWK